MAFTKSNSSAIAISLASMQQAIADNAAEIAVKDAEILALENRIKFEPTRVITASDTVTLNDKYIQLDGPSGQTLTLPDPTDPANEGFNLSITWNNTNVWTFSHTIYYNYSTAGKFGHISWGPSLPGGGGNASMMFIVIMNGEYRIAG